MNFDNYENNGLNIRPEPPVTMVYTQSRQNKGRHGFIKTVFASVAGGIVGALLVGIVGSTALPPKNDSSPFSFPQTPAVNVVPVSNTTQGELTPVEIGEKVGPAVVGVITKSTQRSSFFFAAPSDSSGSGIIISTGGHIITNNHVVAGNGEITVILNNGKEYPAKRIGTDTRTDLAVIKIDAEGLTAAELGDSSALRPGELAVAIGNPLGQEFAGSITVGVISAVNRTLKVDAKQFNLIQTDAAINPGNSGGALVNRFGQVVGINTVKISASGVEGLGFAIPISEAKPVIEDLINSGYVKGRPLIGISAEYVNNERAAFNNLPCAGLYVRDVSTFSAAERAGIKRADIITKCNGEVVDSVESLNKIRDSFKVGDTLVLEINRGGEVLNINVVLAEEKPEPADLIP